MQIEPKDKETFKVMGDVLPHHKELERMGCVYEIYQCCYICQLSSLNEINDFINTRQGPRRELPIESFQAVKIRAPVFVPGTRLKIVAGDELVGTLLSNETDEFGVIHRIKILTERSVLTLDLGYRGWIMHNGVCRVSQL